MLNCNNCKSTILDIFIKSMGEGFPEVLFRHYNNARGKNSNNFKQKLAKMKNGDEMCLSEMTTMINDALCEFCQFDDDQKFSESRGSDKYFNLYFEIWPAFTRTNHFLDSEKYETIAGNEKDIIAYTLSDSLIKTFQKICNKEYADNCMPSKEPKVLFYKEDDKDYKEDDKDFKNWKERCFRPEFYSSFSDVLKEARNNKTFYKWPIDEFKKNIKNKYETVMSKVFGDDYYSYVAKLKTKKDSRRWTSFEKLFGNKTNDKELDDMVKKTDILADYQIFQSRMLAAYFLENFRAVLPDYVGQENADKMWKIFYSIIDNEKLQNLEVAFNIKTDQS